MTLAWSRIRHVLHTEAGSAALLLGATLLALEDHGGR